ncbi:hypothetical protein IJV57_05060 [Candidatus Saccharibacteria bacterium]|jgi:hypothetical protein|nr:hypothetical protein [Candidatus Saccharibacteria bacterium]
MQYKILVQFHAPEIEEDYEAYIPINKTIGEVSNLLLRVIREKYSTFAEDGKVKLYDKYAYRAYRENDLIRNTDIKNGSELIVIS